ncbi:MAG: GNAT family N-acetyltransferase [Thaumarchaeota archaeon]|nr:GNAT family N-acetyltransferase [Nitrososphaerota archaeon]
MVVSNDRGAYELNELSWWSRWAELTWLGKDIYLLASRDFDEYFFNRAGFVRIPPDAQKSLASIEHEFEKRGRRPYIFVRQDRNQPRLLRALADGRYRIADQMAVMQIETPSFVVNSEVQVEIGAKGRLEEWVAVYLRSFYGEESKQKQVEGVLREAPGTKETTLMLARLGDRPVGCLALFRSGALCGVYCVGTDPDFRRRNVASTMLDQSRRLAASEGRRLFLQTILSDSLQRFYTKLGFETLYVKDMFVKDMGLS